MKKRSIRQCIIKGHTWEHGYDKEELAKVLEELYLTDRKEGFIFTICGDTLKARKSGEWIYWMLTTKDGRRGEYKSLDYVTENYPEDFFARQICFALMKTAFDASLSEEQRTVDGYIENAISIYMTMEEFAIQMEGRLPVAVIQAGKKICSLSKADRREALFFIFQTYTTDPRSGLDGTRKLDDFAKSRIDWYLGHIYGR